MWMTLSLPHDTEPFKTCFGSKILHTKVACRHP